MQALQQVSFEVQPAWGRVFFAQWPVLFACHLAKCKM